MTLHFISVIYFLLSKFLKHSALVILFKTFMLKNQMCTKSAIVIAYLSYLILIRFVYVTTGETPHFVKDKSKSPTDVTHFISISISLEKC
jgi:hypothetical protein